MGSAFPVYLVIPFEPIRHGNNDALKCMLKIVVVKNGRRSESCKDSEGKRIHYYWKTMRTIAVATSAWKPPGIASE